MAINDCPHCGKPAISFVGKALLGPARSVKCIACGQRISVGWSAMLLLVPILGALWFGQATGISFWLLLPVLLVVMTVLDWYLVPLVKR